MRFRSVVLSISLIFLIIAGTSCNTRWDTTWAIPFPESFRGQWASADGSSSVRITDSRYTISVTGQSSITNESEYRYKFDWIEPDIVSDTLVTVTPTNVSGTTGRVDTFTINDDGTLSIDLGGENPRSFGPFTKQSSN